MKLILGSGSPRRKEMLEALGLSFDVVPADIDETPLKGETPRDYVARVAAEKARVMAQKNPACVVLAADTTVAVGRRILGKPENAEDAARMIRLLAGRRHKVISTVCVLGADGNMMHKTSESVVKMRPLREADVQAYVAEKECWEGAAGSYKIQHFKASSLIQWMKGSYTGVVGMPLDDVVILLRRAGLDL